MPFHARVNAVHEQAVEVAAIGMQRLGYSEQRIRKILGLNWLRVIRQVTEKGR